jgi:hypothetical protein
VLVLLLTIPLSTTSARLRLADSAHRVIPMAIGIASEIWKMGCQRGKIKFEQSILLQKIATVHWKDDSKI